MSCIQQTATFAVETFFRSSAQGAENFNQHYIFIPQMVWKMLKIIIRWVDISFIFDQSRRVWECFLCQPILSPMRQSPISSILMVKRGPIRQPQLNSARGLFLFNFLQLWFKMVQKKAKRLLGTWVLRRPGWCAAVFSTPDSMARKSSWATFHGCSHREDHRETPSLPYKLEQVQVEASAICTSQCFCLMSRLQSVYVCACVRVLVNVYLSLLRKRLRVCLCLRLLSLSVHLVLVETQHNFKCIE